MSIVGKLMRCLFPGYCFGCRKIGAYICPVCRAKLSLVPRYTLTDVAHIDGVVSIYWYKGVFQKVLKGIKYYGVGSALEDILNTIPCGLIKSIFSSHARGQPVLVPVPQHPRRRCERSFNQADRIARFLQRETGYRVREDVIERVVYTAPLAHIPKPDRARVIRGAFRVTAKDPPDSVVIVDDVWTTGSTIKEITRVLRAAGVRRVWAFTLARSFEPRHAIIR